jgi:hypothetical protein
MFKNIVQPEFYAIVSRFAREPDFVDQGLWLDRACVEAIKHGVCKRITSC